VNANLIFKWLRDPRLRRTRRRFRPCRGGALSAGRDRRGEQAPAAGPVAENRIEIELAGGHRMRISGGYDPEALARLIRGLTA
jgi:transposase